MGKLIHAKFLAKANFFFLSYDKENAKTTYFCMYVFFLFKNSSKSKIITENIFLKILIREN